MMKKKTLLPPEAGSFKVCLPSRASLGCGSFKKHLVLRPLGEFETYLPQLVGCDFVRALICQAFAPQRVEPDIKTAVDHVSLIPDECHARYPYNYE
jgi:hypothetical protein